MVNKVYCLRTILLDVAFCTLWQYCVVSNYHHLGYERIYLPLFKVTDTPFHIQGDEVTTYKIVCSKHLTSSEHYMNVIYKVLDMNNNKNRPNPLHLNLESQLKRQSSDRSRGWSWGSCPFLKLELVKSGSAVNI